MTVLRPWRDTLRSTLSLNHALRLNAETFNRQLHRIAWPQEHRLRLHALTDARRRAGGDHVARIQRDEVTDIADQLYHAEDHCLGRAVLEALAIDLSPQRQILRIAYLVFRHHPRSGRAERV